MLLQDVYWSLGRCHLPDGIRRADGITAMAVAPPRVCVDGWFILGAMIALMPTGVQPHPARVQSV